MDPKTPRDSGITSESEQYNARLGLWLFLVYCICYGGFMGLSAFKVTALRDVIWRGVPLSLWYGFGLIAGALVLAVIYMVLCRPESASEKSKS